MKKEISHSGQCFMLEVNNNPIPDALGKMVIVAGVQVVISVLHESVLVKEGIMSHNVLLCILGVGVEYLSRNLTSPT